MSTFPNYGNTGRCKFPSWAEQISEDLWRCISELDEEHQSFIGVRWGEPLTFAGERSKDNVFNQFSNSIDGRFNFFCEIVTLCFPDSIKNWNISFEVGQNFEQPIGFPVYFVDLSCNQSSWLMSVVKPGKVFFGGLVSRGEDWFESARSICLCVFFNSVGSALNL